MLLEKLSEECAAAKK